MRRRALETRQPQPELDSSLQMQVALPEWRRRRVATATAKRFVPMVPASSRVRAMPTASRAAARAVCCRSAAASSASWLLTARIKTARCARLRMPVQSVSKTATVAILKIRTAPPPKGAAGKTS